MSPAIPVRRGPFWKLMGKWVLQLQGWRFDGEMPDRPKFVAIMIPHTSNWDFVVGMSAIFALGIDLRWIGKHTLFRWPFGGLMRWMGGTPVDRKHTKGLVAGTVDLFRKHDKFVVGLSPEGPGKRWRPGEAVSTTLRIKPMSPSCCSRWTTRRSGSSWDRRSKRPATSRPMCNGFRTTTPTSAGNTTDGRPT